VELSDLILLILYKAGGKLSGKIRLQKLIDLFRLDSKIDVDVKFEPYRFGDFSDDIVNIAGILCDNNFIDITNEEIENFDISTQTEYSLTDDGKKIAKKLFEQLKEEEKKEISRIIELKKVPWKILVKCCYFWFPETAKRSEIKSRLFYKRSTNIPNDLLAEEYEKVNQSGKTIKELVLAQWKGFF